MIRNRLKCVDFLTGKEHWEKNRIKHGTVLLADGQIILLTEKGTLQIGPARTDDFVPTGVSQILEGRCWTIPTLSKRAAIRQKPGQGCVRRPEQVRHSIDLAANHDRRLWLIGISELKCTSRIKKQSIVAVIGGAGRRVVRPLKPLPREGARTLLVEQYGFLGGMATAGLVPRVLPLYRWGENHNPGNRAGNIRGNESRHAAYTGGQLRLDSHRC